MSTLPATVAIKIDVEEICGTIVNLLINLTCFLYFSYSTRFSYSISICKKKNGNVKTEISGAILRIWWIMTHSQWVEISVGQKMFLTLKWNVIDSVSFFLFVSIFIKKQTNKQTYKTQVSPQKIWNVNTSIDCCHFINSVSSCFEMSLECIQNAYFMKSLLNAFQRHTFLVHVNCHSCNWNGNIDKIHVWCRQWTSPGTGGVVQSIHT